MPKHNLLDFSHFQMLYPVFLKYLQINVEKSTKTLLASELLS